MKRFIFAGLATVALAVVAPPASAEPTAFTLNVANSASTVQLAPSELVTMAQRGYLKDQGIASYQVLTSEYILGQINAQKLVQAAINAKLLPPSVANNQGYLNAVEAQLQIQLRVN
ncbi:hypothetical protein [Leptothermofonsia sp. ETS-13]|uniref:hypothetical protein n=1 Tax=Leptothermofonsia sp. ETS-13 TaxID=3035696 RepID=UPI003B9F6466